MTEVTNSENIIEVSILFLYFIVGAFNKFV